MTINYELVSFDREASLNCFFVQSFYRIIHIIMGYVTLKSPTWSLFQFKWATLIFSKPKRQLLVRRPTTTIQKYKCFHLFDFEKKKLKRTENNWHYWLSQVSFRQPQQFIYFMRSHNLCFLRVSCRSCCLNKRKYFVCLQKKILFEKFKYFTWNKI